MAAALPVVRAHLLIKAFVKTGEEHAELSLVLAQLAWRKIRFVEQDASTSDLGLIRCRRMKENIVADIAHIFDAGEDHADLELFADDIERGRNAPFAHRGKPIEIGTSDQATARAERLGLENILARTNAAIEEDFDAVTDRACDLGKDGGGGRRSVELPPAMVGYHDAIDPCRCGGLGVLQIRNALEHQLSGPKAANPVDVSPTQGLIEMIVGPGAGTQQAGGLLQIS